MAVDRPLTSGEQRELRALSTRARITSSSCVNDYQWGDLKGDPLEWMQRYFDAFLNEQYAIMIARDWNVPASGAGYVTRFHVDQEFAARYPVRQVGGRDILELWVPAEELDEFNRHIVGLVHHRGLGPGDGVPMPAQER
ncbi:hypothetical protein [Micromonospora sp. DT229]|uniref:hypothetical protein n=1 Tax=Micromonospora sp. DT229 TaxID=3393430 RepID=UPI003CF26C11